VAHPSTRGVRARATAIANAPAKPTALRVICGQGMRPRSGLPADHKKAVTLLRSVKIAASESCLLSERVMMLALSPWWGCSSPACTPALARGGTFDVTLAGFGALA